MSIQVASLVSCTNGFVHTDEQQSLLTLKNMYGQALFSLRNNQVVSACSHGAIATVISLWQLMRCVG